MDRITLVPFKDEYAEALSAVITDNLFYEALGYRYEQTKPTPDGLYLMEKDL